MKAKKPVLPPAAANNHALADLLLARGYVACAPEEVSTSALDLSKAGKLVLRREKKGRGGKTVTLLTGLSLSSQHLEELARMLRKALGCGATVEDGTVVLQGDIAERAAPWLKDHGAKQVVRGN